MGFSKLSEDVKEIWSDNQYMRGNYTYETKPRPPFSAPSRQKETKSQKKDSDSQIH
ncbi:MAG: hypothetical protein IJT44_04760 [Clostridia bacterium]|nr:hypothetical protein [Clostridia bacterium]